jgi:hypothetical protein
LPRTRKFYKSVTGNVFGETSGRGIHVQAGLIRGATDKRETERNGAADFNARQNA